MNADSGGDLVVISNRGPIDLRWTDAGWTSLPTSGGLASMLTPLVREIGLVWMCCVAEPAAAVGQRAALDEVAARASGKLRVVPLPLPETVYEAYYNGVSNQILWMLQHDLLESDALDRFESAQVRAGHDGYLEANARIADAMARSNIEARALLVQDYHLYPLSALLRRACPGIPLLHFTHIPFATPDRWRRLPNAWARAILMGMLGADVVGLQTARDVSAFLTSCQEILGLHVEPRDGTVTDSTGRRVMVRAYPASIDPDRLRAEMQSTNVGAARDRLVAHADRHLVVRTDRLDPAKNQLDGFRAFGRLLERRPDLRQQVRFLAILSPSRTGLKAYRAYGAAVLQVVEEINDRFAETCDLPPIDVHLENDRALSLAALERSEVLLANSLADGMNLVPKEWAMVTQQASVAVISETAGVAVEAADAALLVSPRDVEGTASALADALDMPPPERIERLARFSCRIASWTSRDWLMTQIADLARVTAKPSVDLHATYGMAAPEGGRHEAEAARA
jgi:trehalose 6-phosphate synthase